MRPGLLALLLASCGSELEHVPLPDAVDTGAQPTGTTSEGVRFTGASTCDAPAVSPRWAEVGEAWGLSFTILDDEIYGHQDGCGLAVADVNGDGQADVLSTRMPGTVQQFLRDGDRFEPMTLPMPSGNGALWIDVDGNGHVDLLMGGPMAFMLRATGTGEYRYENFPSLDGEGVATQSVVHDLSPGDYDLDGRLEIMLTRTADIHDLGDWHNSRMLHIEPDGLGIERDAIPEAPGLRHGYDAVTFDMDGDGDLDAYVANDLGMNFGWSTLLRNDGGTLVDAQQDCMCGLPTAAKGADVADIDADGQPELFVSGSPFNTLLSREDAGTWVDITAISGASQLTEDATGWGGVFLDFDNDGNRDIVSAQGDRWNEAESWKAFDAPLQLLHQRDGVFVDRAQELGLTAMGSFRSVVALDMNEDGVEDFLFSQAADRPLLFLSEGCTAAHWIEVDAPVGARVEVTAGGRTQTDWVTLDSGYIATTLPRVHLGLGQTDTVDLIRVFLPGGEMLQAVGPIDARQRVIFPG